MASSNPNAKVNGTVILANLYLSKTSPLFALDGIQHETPMQAYMVYSGKDELETDDYMWERISHTLGLSLASCEITCESEGTFPQDFRKGNALVHCVPDLDILREFFDEHLKCISEYEAPNENDFFMVC